MEETQKQPPLLPRLRRRLLPRRILYQNSNVTNATAEFLWERVERLLDYLDEMFTLHPSYTGGYRAIRRLRMGAFSMYSAHAQWYASYPLANYRYDRGLHGENVHSGTFDNAFWVNGSTSGHMIACGFANDGGAPAEPQMYMFPFASHVITSTGDSTFVIDTTKGDECSPLTEFYNGTTDRMFFGVGSTTDGYLESSTITTSLTKPTCTGAPTSSCVTSPSALGGTSGIVIDNQLSNGGTNIYFSTMAAGSVNGQQCNVSGGSATPHCAVKLTQSALQ